jgi:hypothetical protein
MVLSPVTSASYVVSLIVNVPAEILRIILIDMYG